MYEVDAAFAKRYTDKVVGVKAACGVTITSISRHALERIKVRNVSEDALHDLITQAPVQYPGNKLGMVCQQKANLRLVITDSADKEPGKIVTVVDLMEGIE